MIDFARTGSASTSMPLTTTVPLVGRERPATMRIVVVLPAPVAAVEGHGAAGGGGEAGHDADRRGLAGAGRAEEAEDRAGRGGEAQTVDGGEITVSLCGRGGVCQR